jgi:3-hydroxyisobutyrate dehydrogenase-like beta-hydroxyacid dehydrogenase
MTSDLTVGFIGLGVMGEPICRNIAMKSGRPVLAYDRVALPLQRLARHGVEAVGDIAPLIRRADIVFLSLPSGKEVEEVMRGPNGILANLQAGQIVVDLGTSPVRLTRELAADVEKLGAAYADAPVARTREAAEQGRLSIMVGATPEVAEKIRPLLACCATDITLCGAVGAGQLTKIMNNMVLFETVSAISEAVAIARRSGVDADIVLDALSKGSADSFALRNHAMKAILPDSFPEQAFSTAYALKDLTYALEMGRELSLDMAGAETVRARMLAAIEAGDGDRYWPVIAKVVDRK